MNTISVAGKRLIDDNGREVFTLRDAEDIQLPGTETLMYYAAPYIVNSEGFDKKQYLINYAKNHEDDIGMSIEEFIDYINGKNKDEQFDRIYIDELDRFLNVFSNGKIKGYSLTIDENDNKGNVKEKALNKLKDWLNG